MTYRVEITATAQQDADAILDWLISHHAGDAGLRWFLALQDAIDSLSDFPDRCPRAPETSHFSIDVRQLLYGQAPHVYRILFTVERESVYVLHIRHGRRQPLKE